MAGAYRPRHPERTVLYRVLFHHFDSFLTMKGIAFITEYAVVDRIIDHLKLRFVADKPPPFHVFEQVALTAAEESGEYF
jgi:hypothetical protein